MRKLVWPLLVLAAPVYAAPVYAEPGLPERAAVVAALDAHPAVLAAQARSEAARAEAEALGRGAHETLLTTGYNNRTVRDEGRYSEFEAQLTRPIRLPGKAGLDRRIGAEGITYAANMAEDARHQVALNLASAWWNWLGAAGEARVDAQAVGNYAAVLASVARRAALRDAAALEVDQARAALSGAQAAAEGAAGRAAIARARLVAQFPGFALPAQAPEVPLPEIPAGGLMALHDRILGRSHELRAAEALAAQAEAQAERARRDKVADPSVGLRVFSEKGGMERGAGVLFSMPLGGGYRSALADKAGAQASAAQADLAAVRLTIDETADADMAEAQAARAAWDKAREAVAAQVAALAKLRRGQALGEIGLAEVLLGERQAHEAFREEVVARAEALRALTRLRIDSHTLWIDDEEDAKP